MPAHYEVIYDFGTTRLDEVLDLFTQTTWAAERSEEHVAEMLEGEQALIGLIDPEPFGVWCPQVWENPHVSLSAPLRTAKRWVP